MNIGIIGGSGANEVIAALGVDAVHHSIGDKHDMRGVEFIAFNYEGSDVIFVQRHGAEHTRDPARLDPRGIVDALEGVMGTDDSERLIIQTSASGSLDTTIKLVDEGGIVVCNDVMRGYGFITQTFGGENGRELHAVMDGIFSEKARRLALDAIAQVKGATAYDGGIYVNNQGNQFETRAEIGTLSFILQAPQLWLRTFEYFRGERAKQGLSREEPTLDEYEAKFQRWDQNVNIRHATVSMNAMRELTLLGEARFRNVVLLSLPTNYGVGLVPDEQVDHKRTTEAIAKAAPLYIAPTLMNMIKMAQSYMR